MIKKKSNTIHDSTLHSENNQFSLCHVSYFAQGQFRNWTVPGRNSYFARQSENSYFIQDNSRILLIPILCEEDIYLTFFHMKMF